VIGHSERVKVPGVEGNLTRSRDPSGGGTDPRWLRFQPARRTPRRTPLSRHTAITRSADSSPCLNPYSSGHRASRRTTSAATRPYDRLEVLLVVGVAA